MALIVAIGSLACSGGDDPATGGPESVVTSQAVATGDTSAPVRPDVSSDAVPLVADDPDPAAATPASRCDSAAAEPVTLRVWHALNGDVEGLAQVIIGRFEAEHPGFRVELEKVSTDYPAAIDRLRETPDDALPDIIMGTNQTVRLQADSDRFIPIVECTDGRVPEHLSDLLPTIRRTYTVEDVLWAAPFNVSTPVMLYDRARWRAAGLDPDVPPADFAELVIAIRRLKDSGEAAAGALLYDRSAMWFLDQAAAKEDRLLIEPANGRQGLDVDAVRFHTSSATSVLATLHELKRDGYVEWIGLNASGIDDLPRMIHATEPGGMTFNSSAVIGDVSRRLSSGDFPRIELGVAPFPGPGSGSTAGGGAWWLLDTGDPARAGAAWLLVDWLTQPSVIAEIAAYTGYVPTTWRAAEHPITQERWEEAPAFAIGFDQLASTPDSDAGAGIQVGPTVEVLRHLELAAAYSIDVGNDPAEELRKAEALSLEILELYAETFEDGD